MSNCPKCGSPGLIVESSPDGKTKTEKCLKCGHTAVKDTQGRPLLQEVPERGGQLLLG